MKKFAMRGQNAPNWAILGEQGEFCPAHAVRRGLLGEFCTGSGVVRLVQGEFCIEAARHGSCWASFVPHMREKGGAGRVLSRHGAAPVPCWAWATTHRVNVRRMRPQKRVRRARRPPDAPHASPDTTRGGTPKGPASRCVRWPRRQRPSLSSATTAAAAASRRVFSSSTSP